MGKSIMEDKEQMILNRLAIILKEEKWNNKQLAEKIGYDVTTVSLWANNHVQPSTTTFARIALVMNRNLQDYFINTLTLDKAKKGFYLKELSAIALRSKRTGKSKTKSNGKTKKQYE